MRRRSSRLVRLRWERDERDQVQRDEEEPPHEDRNDGPGRTASETPDELPARIQEALGELAGAAKEGLMALSVGVGLGVFAELMEAEVDEVVGP